MKKDGFIGWLSKKYIRFPILFLVGILIIFFAVFIYDTRIKPANIRNYYIDAKVIGIEDNVLTVKGSKDNPEYSIGTYHIKIKDKTLISDWETKLELGRDALKDNEYVTVVFTGQEHEIKDNGYLKSVGEIYCNVEDRGFIKE